MKILGLLENIINKLKTRKVRKISYLVLMFIIVGWFAYRFIAVAYERNLHVVNVTRVNAEIGTPIRVMKVTSAKDFLNEPINVKNNRAYVSGARVRNFKVGQSLGECKIISVSNNIDLDSGMYVIKTSHCEDGLLYVQMPYSGLFVPSSAVFGNTVYVVNSGKAEARTIEIIDRDLQKVLIQSGITDGELLILSTVRDGQKVKIINE